MKNPQFIKNESGFSIVEAMLAATMLVILLTGIIGALFYGIEGTRIAGKRVQASYLAEEGMEAVRNIKESNFATFAGLANGDYGLTTSGGQWQLDSGNPDITEGYTRTITLAPGTSDSRDVTVTINWQQNLQRTGQLVINGRFTNWGSTVTPPGSWLTPTVDASINIAGNDDGRKVQIVGNYAYIVMAGGAPNFLIYDISNPSSPTLAGSLTLNGPLNNIFVEGNYAYIASADNSQELQIIDVSNPNSPSLYSSYNDTRNDDARGVYKDGNYVYLALNGGSDFVIVNVTNPLTPTNTGNLTLNGGAIEVTVSGNYAYVSSDSNSQEIQVVNITNKSAPSLSTSVNLSGNSNADTIAHSGSELYIGQGTMLHTYSISSPATPSAQGSLAMGGGTIVNDIAFDQSTTPKLLYLATGGPQGEFATVNITTLTAPTLYSALNYSGGSNYYGVAYSPNIDRAVIVGSPNSAEILVVKPN